MNDKYNYKIAAIFSLINIYLAFVNIQKHFLKIDKIDLTNFRRNEYMNIALAARPYEQITDYFISKNNLDNGYQIIKNEKIIPPKNNFPTSLGNKKIIKIGYVDISDKKGIFYFHYLQKILNNKYQFKLEQKNPDYLIFSFYGCHHNDIKYNDSIKIAIYEENYFPSFNEEDYIFGVNHIFLLDRYFRKSPLIEYINELNLSNQNFTAERLKSLNNFQNKKFCGTIMNDKIEINYFKDSFMKELSKYKHVDTKFIDYNISNNILEEIKFFSSFKFVLIFEKFSADGYATSQILLALLAGTIPIYYGDYLIDEYINPNTFILIRGHVDMNDKIKYIKAIDQNDRFYKQMLKEQVLLDDNLAKKIKADEINFWNHIFMFEKEDAKRINSHSLKTRQCKIINQNKSFCSGFY